MKKRLVIIVLASLAFSNMALAITDPGENSLGVYFDEGTFDVNCLDIEPSTLFSMYFVLANSQFENIGGFEFGWAFDPDPTGLYFFQLPILPAGALDVEQANNFSFTVGLGMPLVAGEATVLVELPIFPISPFIADITVGPATQPTIEGRAAFNDYNDVGNVVPMNFATVDGIAVIVDEQGWVRPGVARIPCFGPVATEPSSWGSVKALFN